jgi:glucose/arabinose dehydrogenase
MGSQARHAAALVFAVLLCSACGGSSNPPPPGTPGPGGGSNTITGRERIGWLQQAQDDVQLAMFDYAIYVDGSRQVLTSDTCTPASGDGFDCSAALPPLSPGQHTLELVAFFESNGAVLESDRSAPLQVTVAGSSAPVDAAPPQDSTFVTSDGHRFRASIVARDLDDPTDLAVASDGRVFVTERAGRVRIAGPDGFDREPALLLENIVSSDESGLTAIALHPDFDRTGYIYLAYASEARGGPGYRIARFREHGGVLAQGATIARERAPAAQHAALRFGGDGHLYAGLAAGTDPRDAQNPASPLGKILRLNDDGTSPSDNPRASPVFSSGHREPRALAWDPADGVLWALERDREAGDELNRIVGGADYGWPLARGASIHHRSIPATLVLPPGTDVSGASVVPPNSGSPLAGEMLVGSRGARELLRLRVRGGKPGLVEGMLQGRYGSIAAVHASQDGTIYLATANRDTWGPGRDVLVTVTAVR